MRLKAQRNVLISALGVLLTAFVVHVARYQQGWASAADCKCSAQSDATARAVAGLRTFLDHDTMTSIPLERAGRATQPEQLGQAGPWKGFGKELCIINVDTRHHDGRSMHGLTNITEFQSGVAYHLIGAYRNMMYGASFGVRAVHPFVAPISF